MIDMLILLLFIFALSLIYVYNILVRLQVTIDTAWANIDVLLKQRFDEIPNLIETVKGYAKHEKTLFTKITKLRSQYMKEKTVEHKGEVAKEATQTIRTIFALAENYPELKANENFLKLQKRISDIEDIIADRREYYNETVRIYNTRIHQVPYNMISAPLKFEKRDYFGFNGK
jgi:LemA protein